MHSPQTLLSTRSLDARRLSSSIAFAAAPLASAELRQGPKAVAPPATCLSTRKRRELSPLEKIIKSRQYNPRRPAAGRK